jgi:hypothetical protein
MACRNFASRYWRQLPDEFVLGKSLETKPLSRWGLQDLKLQSHSDGTKGGRP